MPGDGKRLTLTACGSGAVPRLNPADKLTPAGSVTTASSLGRGCPPATATPLVDQSISNGPAT